MTDKNPEEWQGEERRKNSPNISVVIALAGLTLAFLVQFGGTIWWGATLSANVTNLTQLLAKIDNERYTHSDAARDLQRLDQRDSSMVDQINEIRARVTRLEDREAPHQSK